jgi:hypothetical protein
LLLLLYEGGDDDVDDVTAEAMHLGTPLLEVTTNPIILADEVGRTRTRRKRWNNNLIRRKYLF